MTYIDGFVAAVPTANKEQYLEHAKDAMLVFKKYGVLRMVENWGDDVSASIEDRTIIGKLLSHLETTSCTPPAGLASCAVGARAPPPGSC